MDQPVPTSKDAKRSIRRLLLSWRGLVVMALLVVASGVLFSKLQSKGEWDRYRQELAAKGERLDWKYFIPAPVKDEENFYTAPGMKEMFLSIHLGQVSDHPSPWRLPATDPSWADRKDKELFIETEYGVSTPVSILLQWEKEHQPLIQILFTAAQRPKSRVDDYTPLVYDNHVIPLRTTAQTMATLARAHLMSGHPEKAMPYLNGIYRLMDCVKNGPTLVEAMIHVAIANMYAHVVQFGLERKVWTDEQLRTLQQDLARKKCLPAVVTALRMERAATLEVLETRSFRELRRLRKLNTPGSTPTTWQLFYDYTEATWLGLQFGGAREKNLLNLTKWFQIIIDTLDADAERAHPGIYGAQYAKWNTAAANKSAGSVLLEVAVLNYSKCLEVTSHNQTMVNEAAVACALELYRRTEGHYPTALNELSERSIAKLPHDLIGGESLHYQRTAPDKFVLYSIGWDETDNHGSTTNDWVWGVDSKN